MSPLLDRVRKLIALTTSSSQEEARTAAFEAARLIRTHGLVITDKEPAPPPKPPRSPEYRIIVTKYPGFCTVCCDPIEVGQVVAWARDMPVFHKDCWVLKNKER